ncbi:DUF4157 domain-containing protein [Actinomycetota bacterium Odt1-20B]
MQRSPSTTVARRFAAQDAHAHEVVPDTSPEGQAALLAAAKNSPSESLPSAVVAKAVPFYQNDRIASTRVHRDPISQRATAAMGAEAMTIDNHIFLTAEAASNEETIGHELSHVDKNTRGIVETGHDNGAGAAVTDPRQGSEVAAKTDGAAFKAGETTAPSLTAQRTATTATDRAVQRAAGSPTVQGAAQAPTVQRMESPPRGRRGSGSYDADASASSSESEHGRDADSSPDREELHRRILQHQEESGNIDDLLERTQNLASLDIPRFRAVRGQNREADTLPGSSPASAPPTTTSSSAGTAGTAPAATATAAPEPLPELPENTLLAPLRTLLMRELHAGGAQKKLKVTLKVDAGDLPRRNLGHVWIEINGSKGEQASFGFYPFGAIPAISDVQGGVRCPDPHRKTTHRESKNVTLRQIANGYRVAHEKALADYNLTQHNCTTFAGEAWKAITGQDIPQTWLTGYGLLGTVVPTPAGAADGVASHQAPRLENRRARMRPFAESPLRGVIPGAGTADQVADRMARAGLSQSSSSESSEEVD